MSRRPVSLWFPPAYRGRRARWFEYPDTGTRITRGSARRLAKWGGVWWATPRSRVYHSKRLKGW